MSRPRKYRCCRNYQADRIYKPQGIPLREMETVVLSLDEFEVLRLCDSEGLDQNAAGEQMGISRGTVQRILYRARRELVRAVLENKALLINLKESEDENAGMSAYNKRVRAGRCNK